MNATSDSTPSSIETAPSITLVGAGVVGSAILNAHVKAGLSIHLADQDADAVRSVVASLDLAASQWNVSELQTHPCGLPSIAMKCKAAETRREQTPILIESIPERLDLKRSFFSKIESLLDSKTVFCSNTSSLRISEIASSLQQPQRFCGMHFFMPVFNRDAVEVIRGRDTTDSVMQTASQHVLDLGKTVLAVRDSPGFIVNRLLSPYLNEALQLLCQGATAAQLQQAAREYGMPMSPLELIDTIGARTLFDAGRVYWQAFPNRIAPSPLLAGLVKSKHLGKHTRKGLYEYDENGDRSAEVCGNTTKLVNRYRRGEVQPMSLSSIVDRLSIPMWIEAAEAVSDGTVTDVNQFNVAMHGGLGYRREPAWLAFFENQGSDALLNAVDQWSTETKAIRLADPVRNMLIKMSPTETLRQLGLSSAASRETGNGDGLS